VADKDTKEKEGKSEEMKVTITELSPPDLPVNLMASAINPLNFSSTSSSSSSSSSSSCSSSSSTTEQKELSSSCHHPRVLIPELCALFYTLKWVTGTGGGLSIRQGDEVYIAPSGVAKERIQPDDLFVLTPEGKVISSPPPERGLKPSQCTPLFFNAYRLRSAGACIHTHSQAAVMVSLLNEEMFVITHQEMIKGIRNGRTGRSMLFWQTLVVPIIENTAEESDLSDRMVAAMEQYPETCAVIVRRHGLYVWGADWAQCKAMAECYDYLFEIALTMRLHQLDPAAIPKSSEYWREAEIDRLATLKELSSRSRPLPPPVTNPA